MIITELRYKLNSLKLFVFIFFMSFANECFASSEIGVELAKSLKQNIHEPNITSTVICLLIVICMIYITAIIYTKLSKFSLNTAKKQLKEENDTNVTVLSTKHLGNNKVLHVIEIAGNRLLIGATQNSLQLLDVLSDKSEPKVKTFSVGKMSVNDENQSTEIKNEEKKIDENEEFGLYKKYLK